MNKKISHDEIDYLLDQLGSDEGESVKYPTRRESGDGLYITDNQGKIIRVNTAYEKITGLSRKDIVGRSMDSIVNEQKFDHSVTREALEKRKSITILQQSLGDKEVIVTSTPVLDEKNEVLLVVTSIRDIIQLNALLEQLKNTRRFHLYPKSPDPDDFKPTTHGMVVKSQAMKEAVKKAMKAAKADASILLLGETGVGKSMLAAVTHQMSHRKDNPFIKINCGAIPVALMESELFGYEKGAFTGASHSGKKGLIEAAHKGTVFLDEVAELSLNMQVKLLEVIEEKTFLKIGSNRSGKVDINIIAATNRDLKEMVHKGTFREDLYYRLNVFPITIPPLRARKEDIPALVSNILAKFNKQKKLNRQITSRAVDMLSMYDFPGNIRELGNIVERMFILCESNRIDITDLPDDVRRNTVQPIPDPSFRRESLAEAMEGIESRLIQNAVSRCASVAEAAGELGIHTSTLWRKARKYSIG